MTSIKQQEGKVNRWINKFFRNKPDAFVTALLVGLFLGAVVVNPGVKYVFSLVGG
jgi:hypothetical protein